MSYSIEVRAKALMSYNEGEGSQEEVASLYQISLSTFKRWIYKVRHGESLKPKTERCGRPRKVDEKGEETIRRLVEENPSITLEELSKVYYREHKIVVGTSILSRILKELNLRYKKLSIKAVERDKEEVQKKRAHI